MRTALSTRAASKGDFAGPNWWGVGRVEVDADLGLGIGQGSTLLVNFDRRRVVGGGHYLVTVGGWPELVRFRRFPRGLCARIGCRWIAMSGDDLCDMTVVGRVLAVRSTSQRA